MIPYRLYIAIVFVFLKLMNYSMQREHLFQSALCILACKLFIRSADGATHTMDNVLDFFPETNGDGLNVIWAHGVNSLDELNGTLEDDTMMIETDIILRGIGTVNQTNIPVHAHPPLTDSDLTLQHFLTVTTQYPDKGIKLDFKYLEALGPSMELVMQFESELKTPLWLNADIVIGPNSPRDPIAPQPFIDIANSYFDKTTLSLGFTTDWGPLKPEDRYTWTMIFDNLYYSYPLDPQPVTFPIRAVWCKTSWAKFVWLLGLRDSFSITVWSSASDAVAVSGLVDLRTYGDTKRIFYDLPDYQKAAFLQALNDPTVTPTPRVESPWDRDDWVAFENSERGNFAFLSTESLGISGNASRPAIVHSRVQHMPPSSGEDMRVKGRIQFVERYDSSSESYIEIYLRSNSLLNDEQKRTSVLGGSDSLSGLRYAVYTDGTIEVGRTTYYNRISRADCYDFEIADKANGSFDTILVVRTCADAPSEHRNEGQSFSVSGFELIDKDHEFYVIVTMTGGGADVIVEGLSIEGSVEPGGAAAAELGGSYYLNLLMTLIVVVVVKIM